MTTIASFGISVDSRSAVQAALDLDAFTDSASGAELAAKDLASSTVATAQGAKSAAAAVQTLAVQQVTANQALNAAGISAGQYRVALQQLPFQIHDNLRRSSAWKAAAR